jgi:hypothetical protein
MSTKATVLLWLMLSLSACAESPYPQVLFPASGAILSNPVRLETATAVTWSIDGKTLTTAAIWRGDLSPGTHFVTASTGLASTEFSVTVREAFPKGIVRSVREADLIASTLEVSSGEYWMVLGNPNAKQQVWQTSRANDAALPTPQSEGIATFRVSDAALLQQLSQRTQAAIRAGVQALKPPMQIRALEEPIVGSSRSFQVLDLNGSGSSSVETNLLYFGPHVLAYVEPGLDSATLESIRGIAKSFDTRIYDLDLQVFGPAADVDGNGRVILLFTPKLNASKQAVGFFFQGDLLERTQDNPDSNQADILYLGVPVNNDANFSVRSLEATTCHEFQHLIHYSRKTLPHLADAQPPEENVAINEGLSHLAEDLCGYNLKGGNLAFVARFLAHPEKISLDGLSIDGKSDSIERRGAMYLFMRFLLEQYGSGFIKNLISSSGSGLENVAQQLNQPLDALMWRWWWATALKPGSKYGQIRGFNQVQRSSVTGDVLGVNVWAGSLEVIPGVKISLQGPHSIEDWPSSLPSRGAAFRYVTGPVKLKIPSGAELSVLRVR